MPPCSDLSEECSDYAKEGKCTGQYKSEMRRNCKWSCGYCLGNGAPQRTMPTIGHVKTRELVEMFSEIGDFTTINKNHQTDLTLGIPGLWKESNHKSLCDKPTNGEGSSFVHKIKQSTEEDVSGIKILCMVYTMRKNHKTKVMSQKLTWAADCDGFIAMSTSDDPEIPALEVPHEGKESWDNMWQKVRSIWGWTNSSQIDNFDYFLIGGDDMYVNIQNHKSYLSSLPQSTPLYVGRKLHDPNGQIDFNAGGAGYTLNRKALIALSHQLDEDHCSPHGNFFWEDVNVARCLRNIGIHPIDTRDDSGAERYHPLNPDQLVNVAPTFWLATYSTNYLFGIKSISESSTSFHYLSVEQVRGLHYYFHHCDEK